MAVAVKSLGLPWIHEGVTCTNCHCSPISGYRHKCQSCENHNLCGKCHRLGHPQWGHEFLRIDRDSNNFHPPFQLHYVSCDECGLAPIEGRRYQHRWGVNRDMCEPCFSKQLARTGRLYKLVADVETQTICSSHQPVYHFHKRCRSCGVKPIVGPRYDSKDESSDCALCLVCYDTKFTNQSIKKEEFTKVERPEADKVIHIVVFSCLICGEAPICGPAFVPSGQRASEKTCCLLCYMNLPGDQQVGYSRVDPPNQLGDLPAPAVVQKVLPSHELEKLMKDKDDEVKAIANMCSELRHKLNLRNGRAEDHRELERVRRERDRAVSNCAEVGKELERMRKEKEELEQEKQALQNRIEELEQEAEEAEGYGSQVEELEQETEEFEGYGSRVEELEQENQALQNRIEELEQEAEEAEGYGSRVEELEQENQALQDRIEELEQVLEEYEREARDIARTAWQAQTQKADAERIITSWDGYAGNARQRAFTFCDFFRRFDGYGGRQYARLDEERVLARTTLESLLELIISEGEDWY